MTSAAAFGFVAAVVLLFAADVEVASIVVGLQVLLLGARNLTRVDNWIC